MRYICIENDGVAEGTGLRLMGASSKDGSKIGTFGTGWKYGMAGVVRLAGPFPICLGTDVVDIATTTTSLRGEEHQELTANGGRLGITDQLGKGWEPWMVLREFIANAIDEGGHSVHLADEVEPVAGKTRIYVPLGPFEEV